MVSDEVKHRWKRKHAAISDAQENKTIILTDWESDFIKGISRLIVNGFELSFHQSKTLNRIYEKII